MSTVELSLVSGRIKVDPDSFMVSQDDSIEFRTSDSNDYHVVMDNFDQFFTGDASVINLTVNKNSPQTLTVNSQDRSTVKYYSVGINSQSDPPYAPPRIILGSSTN